MGYDVRHTQIPSPTNIPANDHKEFMKSYKTNNQTQNIEYLLRTKPLNIYFHVLAIKQIETMKIWKSTFHSFEPFFQLLNSLSSNF